MVRRGREEESKPREPAEQLREGGDLPSITHGEVPVEQTGGERVREVVEGEAGGAASARCSRAAWEPRIVPVHLIIGSPRPSELRCEGRWPAVRHIRFAVLSKLQPLQHRAAAAIEEPTISVGKWKILRHDRRERRTNGPSRPVATFFRRRRRRDTAAFSRSGRVAGCCCQEQDFHRAEGSPREG